MSVELLSCPYCNAQIAPDGRPRLTCPQCGETFTPRVTAGQAIQAPPAVSASPLAAPITLTGEPRAPRRSNVGVAAIVLGVMALMAGAGLALALFTVDVRRGHDRSLPRRIRKPHQLFMNPVEEPPAVVAPARLEALGYLPPATNVVAGIHVEELLASPAGKDLHGQTLQLGKVELRLEAVRTWTGLEMEEIDHAVLGIVLREGEELDVTPPIHLVVRTRRPYEGTRVRAALQAGRGREEKGADGSKRTVYPVKLANTPLPGMLWLADSRTLVLGFFSKLDSVPARPHEGTARLSAELREVLQKRLSAGACLWVVGHSNDWKKTWLPVLLEGIKDVPVLQRLDQVRSFALSVLPDRPVKLVGAFRCSDPATAKLVAGEELTPRAQAQPQMWRFSRDGEWLDVQVRTAIAARE